MESEEVNSTPQSLLLAFLGMHLLWKPIAISGASIVDVFGWLGVGQAAARSLLARMTDRGMLDRHKIGRKTYYSLTPDGATILDDGSRKVWRGAGHSSWDGQWTTVVLSVPEDSRHLRHRARSRLGWAGFGNTSLGLWVAPGRHDVAAILGTEFDGADITVMVGRTVAPTTDRSLVASAFDLDEIARGYVAFGSRWSSLVAEDLTASDAFATRVRLQAQWLSLGRSDPLLPASLLPDRWPAEDAEKLFRRLDATLDRASIGIEASGLDSIAVQPVPEDTVLDASSAVSSSA
ncbi:PaaX family transcriptional regulator [Rhodococcoides trifolii]|uniref:PaaX family transcriptional regulator n=1 Tax=Rhodococcoides trifolii TaxID=908250 RepID=A0A917CPG2_9NOCA|nr:PaaX family transcriptional regulator C-terminal domain-containing protein [Rhodococcus trifolii]GGF94412.1 PaaX family transcriptional regulator [Rhodococcus trifolii]